MTSNELSGLALGLRWSGADDEQVAWWAVNARHVLLAALHDQGLHQAVRGWKPNLSVRSGGQEAHASVFSELVSSLFYQMHVFRKNVAALS